MFHAHHFFKLTNSLFAPFFSLTKNAWFLLDSLPLFLNQTSFDKQSPLERGVFLKNPNEITVGKNCLIEEGSFLEGPCFIGNNCEIRHGAYIRKGSVIGDNCVIGHGTEINRSLILDGAKLAHFNYVGDSIIGEDVNLGAGTKCANLRLDEKEIEIFFEGAKIKTERKKLGALIGFHSSIGCNAVLNPGTIVFPFAKIGPCISVKGVLR